VRATSARSAAITLVSALACVGAHAKAERKVYRAEHMATVIEAHLDDDEAGRAAAAAVFAIFADVDARMSEWKATSPLSAVNERAGGAPVTVPKDLVRVVARGVEIGALTDGAFDVTWAALWGVWDFRAAPGRARVPDAKELARRAALVDYRRVVVDAEKNTVALSQSEMKLGLGGIAKGWALDRAAAELRRRGVRDYLLKAGGQVYAGGANAGRPWRVGVQDPRGTVGDFFALVEVRDKSVSTSGDYERFFIVDGARYHHILDPRTGWPSRGLRSATVVSADATLADALSTAVMVLGRDQGLALVKRLEGVEAIVVDKDGRVFATAGIEPSLRVRHAPLSEVAPRK
jgi:thiamine biosynthesis lipoprotein